MEKRQATNNESIADTVNFNAWAFLSATPAYQGCIILVVTVARLPQKILKQSRIENQTADKSQGVVQRDGKSEQYENKETHSTRRN